MCKGGIAPNPALSWDPRAISFIPWPQPGPCLLGCSEIGWHFPNASAQGVLSLHRTRRTDLGELASHFGCLFGCNMAPEVSSSLTTCGLSALALGQAQAPHRTLHLRADKQESRNTVETKVKLLGMLTGRTCALSCWLG